MNPLLQVGEERPDFLMRERRLGVHMEFSHLPQEDELIHPYWFILLLPAMETTVGKVTQQQGESRSPCTPSRLPALGARKLRAEQGEEAGPRAIRSPSWWLTGEELLGPWPQCPPFFLNKTFSLLLTTPYSSGLCPQGSATTWFWYEHFSRFFLLH